MCPSSEEKVVQKLALLSVPCGSAGGDLKVFSDQCESRFSFSCLLFVSLSLAFHLENCLTKLNGY